MKTLISNAMWTLIGVIALLLWLPIIGVTMLALWLRPGPESHTPTYIQPQQAS